MGRNSRFDLLVKEKFIDKEVLLSATTILEEFERISIEDFVRIQGDSVNIVRGEHLRSNISGDFSDIFEYHFVTQRFAKLLEKKGEAIIYYFSTPIWGRCTTGQRMSMDGVVDEICEELEILEGQRNEWDIFSKDV